VLLHLCASCAGTKVARVALAFHVHGLIKNIHLPVQRVLLINAGLQESPWGAKNELGRIGALGCNLLHRM
jgi:hypothetical protein